MVIVKRYPRLSTLEKKRFALAHSFSLCILMCCLGPLGRNCKEGEGFTLALLRLVYSELTSFSRPRLSFLQSLYKHTSSKQCLMHPSFSSRGLREKDSVHSFSWSVRLRNGLGTHSEHTTKPQPQEEHRGAHGKGREKQESTFGPQEELGDSSRAGDPFIQ